MSSTGSRRVSTPLNIIQSSGENQTFTELQLLNAETLGSKPRIPLQGKNAFIKNSKKIYKEGKFVKRE